MKHANKILGFLVAFAIGTAFAQTVVRDDWDFIGDVTFRGDATMESGITSEGTLNIPDGSIGAGGLAFTNDTDTNIYSTTEDCLGLAQGGADAGQLCVDVQTISAAQIQTLNGTPVALVAAVAGHAFVPMDARFMLDWESAAWDDDDAGEDLQIVGGTSGTVWMSCDNASCLNVDATADAYGYAQSNVFGSDLGIALQSEAINIQIAVGEIFSAAGDSPIIVIMRYRIVELDIS